jgi:hypothetical protein
MLQQTSLLFDEQTCEACHAIGGDNIVGSFVGRSILPVEVHLIICLSLVLKLYNPDQEKWSALKKITYNLEMYYTGYVLCIFLSKCSSHASEPVRAG